MRPAVCGLLWFSALGTGLTAGVYFAFSAFVMASLSRLNPALAVEAMNTINTDIVRSAFMPVFMGTTLSSAALAVAALLRMNEPGAVAMLAAGAIYIAGMFLVTMIFNVPLNDALARQGDGDPAAAWSGYAGAWTGWNHVRTLSSVAASTLFVWALSARR
jgi:uncharacterized membrane protein